MTSYQKRLADIEKLRKELSRSYQKLRIVCTEPDSFKATKIKTAVFFEVEMEKALWFGDSTKRKQS